MMDVQISKKWPDFSLHVSFQTQGETLGMLGASGCGKSVTLKSIAGLKAPDEGHITVNGRTLFQTEKRINLAPQQRKVGYLFQNYALFPHLTVEENICCGLSRQPAEKRQKTVQDLLLRFGLGGLARHFPRQLSGGQQQRVALARILAYNPEVLLLDEPFSALDTHLKEQLQLELLAVLRTYPGQVIMVSHSKDELYRFCEKLLVMEHGACVLAGSTKEIFRCPRHLTAARLIGCKNLSPARVTGRNTLYAEDWRLLLQTDHPIPGGTDFVGIQAHSFRAALSENDPNSFPVQVRETLETPDGLQVQFQVQSRPAASQTDFSRRQAAGSLTPLWWECRRDTVSQGLPTFLSVTPQQVLPLSSGAGGSVTTH